MELETNEELGACFTNAEAGIINCVRYIILFLCLIQSLQLIESCRFDQCV